MLVLQIWQPTVCCSCKCPACLKLHRLYCRCERNPHRHLFQLSASNMCSAQWRQYAMMAPESANAWSSSAPGRILLLLLPPACSFAKRIKYNIFIFRDKASSAATSCDLTGCLLCEALLPTMGDHMSRVCGGALQYELQAWYSPIDPFFAESCSDLPENESCLCCSWTEEL